MSKRKIKTGPFDADIQAAAEKLADSYDIVLRRDDDGEWEGHALEYPECVGFGKTVMECMHETRELLISGVGTMLERGQMPPVAARQNLRTEQVNMRLTPEEKALLESRSRAKGFRGVADYMRSTVLAEK